MIRTVFSGLALAACVGLAGCGGGGGSPAATVNGHDISMRAYNVAVYNQRIKTVSGKGYDPCSVKVMTPECQLLEQNALTALIDKELVHEYADAHGISVSQADSDRAWAIELKNDFHGQMPVVNAFVKRVHETVDDLKAALTDNLLEQRVILSVVKSVPTRAPATQLAVIEASMKVYAQVRGALHFKAFSVVAREELNDPQSGCANLKCGELGWVPNELVPSNRKLLLTAPVGSILQFPHQAYFELYQIERHSPNYALTTQQQYEIRVMRFNGWLAQQERHATVKRYVAV